MEREKTRDELRRRGEEVRNSLGLGSSDLGAAIGFERFSDELVFGAIWGRDALSLRDRMLCTLAALSVLGRVDELERYILAALHIDLEPRAIVEVLAQAGLYGGFSGTENGVAVASRVFAERGLKLEVEPSPDRSIEELDAQGDALQLRLHAEGAKRSYASPDDPVTYGLYSLATRYGYGELWLRAGLSIRERMLCALASFTVLSLESQVKKFAPAALRIGLSRQEVIEAVMQTAPYGGFPRALNALGLVSQALQ